MKIDHVGIAVESLEKALPLYREAFGLRVTHKEEVPAQNVRVVFLAETQGAQTQVELMEPMGSAGAVAKFLSSRGPGMHHLAFRTEALARDMDRLRAAGWPPMEEKARPGSRGHGVCFIHPKHAEGVLVELVGAL